MRFSTDDVIVAPATANGPGLRSIVRFSGVHAVEMVRRFFEPDQAMAWPGKSAQRFPGCITLPAPWQPWRCDALVWPSNKSFTRQPLVELHTSANPFKQASLIQLAIHCGARQAERGEFTLRAFLAGRIDLTQAEAVLGVIDARDSKELATGLNQLAGGLAGPLLRLRSELLDVLAELEAGLDFADEDLEFVSRATLIQTLEKAATQIKLLRQQLSDRGSVTRIPRVVLVGPPNAGKSSLFNRLTQRTAALVSASPGTTRDPLTSRIHAQGIQWELIDTAGLSELASHEAGPALGPSPIDEIDAQAQKLAAASLEDSEVVAVCLPALDWTAARIESLKQQLAAKQIPPSRQVWVVTQIDRVRAAADDQLPLWPGADQATSVVTEQGLEELAFLLAERASGSSASGGGVASTAARSRAALESCDVALVGAIQAAVGEWGDELIAAEIRIALEGLGQVTGDISTDDVLDRIFSRFCIGK